MNEINLKNNINKIKVPENILIKWQNEMKEEAYNRLIRLSEDSQYKYE